MERFTVGEVWTNGIEREEEFYRQFRTTLNRRGLSERKIYREETPRSIGLCRVHFFNPPAFPSDSPAPGALHLRQTGQPPLAGRGSLENNRSIVLKVSCPPYSLILTGDIEQEAELELLDLGELLRATVIKVPHHGSRGAMEPIFLETVSPKVAVISVGAHNPYGHPAPEVLSAYQQLGSQIFRTDQQGAIVIEITKDVLRVRQFSDLVLSPVPWDSKMLFVEWENMKRLVHPSFSLELDKV
jgi:competence protein ComEC